MEQTNFKFFLRACLNAHQGKLVSHNLGHFIENKDNVYPRHHMVH